MIFSRPPPASNAPHSRFFPEPPEASPDSRARQPANQVAELFLSIFYKNTLKCLLTLLDRLSKCPLNAFDVSVNVILVR